MWFLHVAFEVRTSWDNGVEVEVRMRGKVMDFDVFHIDTLLDARSLVEVSAVVHQVRELTDFLLVTFKVCDIDLVEPHKSGKQLDVGESDSLTAKEATC